MRMSRRKMKDHFSWEYSHRNKSSWPSFQGLSSRNLSLLGDLNQLVERELMIKEGKTNSGAQTHSSIWILQSLRIWNLSLIRRVAGVSKVSQLVWLSQNLSHQLNLLKQRSLAKVRIVQVSLYLPLCHQMVWRMHRHSNQLWRKKKAVKIFQILNHHLWRTNSRGNFKFCQMNGSKRPPTKVMRKQHCTSSTSQHRDRLLSSHRWNRKISQLNSHWLVSTIKIARLNEAKNYLKMYDLMYFEFSL